MYAPNYASNFNILNTSVHHDDYVPVNYKTIDNPINVSKDYYIYRPYYETENSATGYAETAARMYISAPKHFLHPTPINDAPDDKTLGFNYIASDYPIFQRINEDPPNLQVHQYMHMINQPSHQYPIEQTLYDQRRPLIRENDTIHKQLQKHKVNINNMQSMSQPVDQLDLMIRNPTDDWSLYQPIYDNLSNDGQMYMNNTQMVNSPNVGQMYMNGAQMVNSPTDNESFTATSLNRSVPIMYANKMPTTCNVSANESFTSSIDPNMGVYSAPSNSESFNPTAPPSNTSQHKSESFKYSNDRDERVAPVAIESYLNTLKARATAVCFYLQNNPSYSRWSENWELLYNNLHKKNRLLFQRLDESDADVAYVVNKGEEIKFRIRDEKRFIPLNIYQYVLYHEMAHMSTTELQHTPFFFELLSIIALAAMEMGFIDLTRLKSSYFRTNGQPILCKVSLVTELSNGCDRLIEANPGSRDYFDSLRSYIKRK